MTGLTFRGRPPRERPPRQRSAVMSVRLVLLYYGGL